MHDDYWDDVPRFGGKARRWYRRLLFHSAIGWLRDRRLPETDASQEILGRMVHAVAEGWKPQVTWKDFDEFRGRNHASGEWRLDEKRLAELWPEVFAAAMAAQEASRYPTLDAWLDAEARGELKAPATEEPWAHNLLRNGSSTPTAASRRWADTFNRLDDRWPRACRACGGEFTWEQTKRNRVRCPACLRARRGTP